MKKFASILFIVLCSQLICTTAFSRTIIFLGDSLTEGYGIEKEKAYPALVEELINENRTKKVTIINGGVSGSTSNDGMARFNWYLKKNPSILLLALGANDGLRGLNLQQTKKNLENIIKKAKAKKIKVLLAGMLMPPNYGPQYTEQFKSMYANLKEKHKLKSMPFLLEGIAGKKEFNQRDGIHPNEKGHELIAKKVYTFLKDEI